MQNDALRPLRIPSVAARVIHASDRANDGSKPYLTEDEIDTLNRLVVIFLETAELRAKES